jgi:hypothetical protein
MTSADLAQSGAGAVQGLARTSAWLGAGATATNVAATAMTATGIGTAVVGGLQMVAGGVKYARARRADKALSKLEGKDDKEIAAIAHLREIQKKRKVRGGLDALGGALMTTGGVMAATGFGLIPGLALGAAGAALSLGRLGARTAKQKLRDRKADKLEAIQGKLSSGADLTKEEAAYKKDADKVRALRDKKARGETLSWSERFKLAFSVNEEKSTKKKDARNEETMNAIIAMDEDKQKVALSALGIDKKKFQQRRAESLGVFGMPAGDTPEAVAKHQKTLDGHTNLLKAGLSAR